jgi:hypothetical protein
MISESGHHVDSYKDADLLVRSHWSGFLKWKSDQFVSYDTIFACLDEISEDLHHRECADNSSIHQQISTFLEDDGSARFYRHFRDFGSLEHFNSEKDRRLVDSRNNLGC